MELSTLEGRKAFAKNYAEKYGIDLALLCAVIEHESSWYPFAVRFEPAFEARYIKPKVPNMPTTRELTLAMSFGLMQVMGEVAYEFGFDGKSFLELTDPDIGVDYGCRKLRKCLDGAGGSETLALLRYNGGRDKSYPPTVIDLKKKYQENTTT